MTAVSPVDGHQVAIHPISGANALGALAWDNGRGVIWGCSSLNTIGTIDLSTNVFTPAFNSQGCFDGLAYDGSDDTIWASGDAAGSIQHYSVTARDGRVYHVSFSASDGQGGSCTGAATIGVPHDMSPKGGPIDEGSLYDSAH